MAAFGAISMDRLVDINAACRYEQAAKVIEHHIANNEIPSGQVAADLKIAMYFTEQRTRAIHRLKLADDQPVSDWNEVDEIRGAEGAEGGQGGGAAMLSEDEDEPEEPEVSTP